MVDEGALVVVGSALSASPTEDEPSVPRFPLAYQLQEAAYGGLPLETRTESFWSTLKNELIHHQRFATRAQAQQAITAYIKIFYNRQRLQAR